MGFWDEPTVGVIIGGVIAAGTQFSTQFWANWRDGKQSTRAAIEQAKAERDALQVRTIIDLQEQLEAVVGTYSAGATVHPHVASRTTAAETRAALAPVGRSVLLCSRLSDQSLANDVRTWLKDMRIAAQGGDATALQADLKDRRLALQGRLGDRLRQYYPD